MSYKPELKKSLIYPVDANPEDFFPECIKFTVKQRLGMNIDKVATETSASLKDLVKKGMNNVPQALKLHNQIKNKSGRPSGGFSGSWTEWITKLKDDFLEVTGQNYDDMDLGSVATSVAKITDSFTSERNRLISSNKGLSPTEQNRKSLGSIYLNMPNAIQFSEAANWSGQSLGVGGNQMEKFMSGGDTSGFSERAMGTAVGNAGNIAGGAVGGMLGTISNLVGLGGNATVGVIAGALGGEALQKGFEAGLSISQNPYMEMMFSGIGFRNFRFDFVLRPRHEKELEEVGEIVKAFREFSRPSWNPAFGGQSFMNYPMEFDISFLTLNESESYFTNFVDNEYLPKLKPCVLSSVETNFTPQSIWAAHKSGAPVAVTLGLAFQETELVMAGDIQSDDWPKSGSIGVNSSEPSAIGNDARMNPGGAFAGGQ